MVSFPKRITHPATSGASDNAVKDSKKKRYMLYLLFSVILLVIVLNVSRQRGMELSNKLNKDVKRKNTSDRTSSNMTVNKGIRRAVLPKNELTKDAPASVGEKPRPEETPKLQEKPLEKLNPQDTPKTPKKPKTEDNLVPQEKPVSKLATQVDMGGRQVAVGKVKNTDLCGMTPVKAPDEFQNGYLTKSAVMVGRNDGYGGHLIERVTAAIRFGLATFDELILVDFNNSPGKKPIVAELPDDIATAPHFKSIVVSLEDCAKLMNLKEERCADYIYESLARNVGIEAATSDVIVSTNIDCIAPSREILDQMVREYMPTWRHGIVLERRPGDESWQNALNRAPRATARKNSTATVSTVKSVELKKKKCVVVENFGRGPNVNFFAASVINYVGDFQVGHRQLWDKASFRWAKNFTGRNSADSFLVMSWMNEGASITVVDRYATHIQHAHTNTPPENRGFKVELRGGKFTFAAWNVPV